MKRLILIQTDYAGAGKTTLAQCFERYLNLHRVPHHSVVLRESMDGDSPRAQITIDELSTSTFLSHLQQADLVLLEVEAALTDAFHSFYLKKELWTVLSEWGFEVTVVVPVTSEEESFDAVTLAAEIFSDSTQYLVAHTPTSSSYDDDSSHWEHSHAARVMDMFEAVDMDMPAAHGGLEFQLKMRHVELQTVIGSQEADPVLEAEVSKWFRKVSSQIDALKKYLFGDAFRPEIHVIPPKDHSRKTRGRKPKSALMQALADAA